MIDPEAAYPLGSARAGRGQTHAKKKKSETCNQEKRRARRGSFFGEYRAAHLLFVGEL